VQQVLTSTPVDLGGGIDRNEGVQTEYQKKLTENNNTI
jgi:hypothetical protein